MQRHWPLTPGTDPTIPHQIDIDFRWVITRIKEWLSMGVPPETILLSATDLMEERSLNKYTNYGSRSDAMEQALEQHIWNIIESAN